jgi:hypothetical protein
LFETTQCTISSSEKSLPRIFVYKLYDSKILVSSYFLERHFLKQLGKLCSWKETISKDRVTNLKSACQVHLENGNLKRLLLKIVLKTDSPGWYWENRPIPSVLQSNAKSWNKIFSSSTFKNLVEQTETSNKIHQNQRSPSPISH